MSAPNILDFRDRHLGERCAILCNGPSLTDHDLARIDCPTIGLNSSWRAYRATYHIMGDAAQFRWYREAHDGDISSLDPLFTTDVIYGSGDPPPPHACVVHAVPLYREQGRAQARWSWDLTECVYPSRTVTMFGLQLAVWMGFRKIAMLGLDLCDRDKHGHFYDSGRRFPAAALMKQLETLGYAAGVLQDAGVRVVNCNRRSMCKAFDRVPFKEVFA